MIHRLPAPAADAPSLEPALRRRLRRLDPNLRLTWSTLSIDALSARIIIADTTREPIVEPMWHLWLWRPGEGWLWTNGYPFRIDDRHIAAMERSAARFTTPTYLLRRAAVAQEEVRQRALQARIEQHRDVRLANRRPIERLVEGRREQRDAKIFIGTGGKRGTPGTVEMDPREAGWELPPEGGR